MLFLDARQGGRWLHAIWGVPGSSAMLQVLRFGCAGIPFSRWFSQIDPASTGLQPRYRWSGRLLAWGALLGGKWVPSPLHVSITNPLPIARWMADSLRKGATPHLLTYATSAVRLRQCARDHGIELSGAQFEVSGEPVTESRLAAIRRTGAAATCHYGSVECGTIGYGCMFPEAADDLHLLDDLHALIQPGPQEKSVGISPLSLFISSLRATSPLILLNVSLGDQAFMVRRSCGCPLERLGWGAHLHTIRSSEKLSGGGLQFLDVEVIRALEEVLPARFGGGPTDYQLLEEEADDGQPTLSLLIHPRVGCPDVKQVVDVFLTELGKMSGAKRIAELVWRDSGVVRAEIRDPLATASGKIQHLHVAPRRSGMA